MIRTNLIPTSSDDVGFNGTTSFSYNEIGTGDNMDSDELKFVYHSKKILAQDDLTVDFSGARYFQDKNGTEYIAGVGSLHDGIYKLSDSTWKSYSTAEMSLTGGCFIYLNNTFYTLGGDNGTRIDMPNSGGLSTGLWLTINIKLLHNFVYGSFIKDTDDLGHFLGGASDDDETVGTTYHYTWTGKRTEGLTMTEKNPLPYAFFRGSALMYEGKIHILGGYGNGTKHYSYDADNDEWTAEIDLPYDFYDGAAIVDNNGVLTLIGGNVSSTSTSYSKAYYELIDGVWTVRVTFNYDFINSVVFLNSTNPDILQLMSSSVSTYKYKSYNIMNKYYLA